MTQPQSPERERRQYDTPSSPIPDLRKVAERDDTDSMAGMREAAADALPPGRVTQLLRGVREGDRVAYDQVFGLVYDELQRVARHQLRAEREADAIRTTELVHELYLRLADQAQLDWENRAHFYGTAARAMRQILIDLARRRKAAKRGGHVAQTTLTGKEVPDEVRLDEVLALDELLEQLDERQRQIVEYRFYGGMSEDEIAEVLGVSTRTVQREWAKARAWLYQALYSSTE